MITMVASLNQRLVSKERNRWTHIPSRRRPQPYPLESDPVNPKLWYRGTSTIQIAGIPACTLRGIRHPIQIHNEGKGLTATVHTGDDRLPHPQRVLRVPSRTLFTKQMGLGTLDHLLESELAETTPTLDAGAFWERYLRRVEGCVDFGGFESHEEIRIVFD